MTTVLKKLSHIRLYCFFSLLLLYGLLTLLLSVTAVTGKHTLTAFAGSDAAAIDPASRQLLNDAKQALTSKDDARAIDLFSKVLASHPDHQESLQALGKLLVAHGIYDEAEAVYSRMLSAKPNDSEIRAQLGVIKFHLRKKYEAQELLYQAVSAPSVDEKRKVQAESLLGHLYDDWNVLQLMREKKDYDGQERFLAYQIDQAPEGAAAAYGLRGFVRQRLGKNAEALRDYEQALEIGGLDWAMTEGVARSRQELLEANRTQTSPETSPPSAPAAAEEKTGEQWQEMLTDLQTLQSTGDTVGLEARLARVMDSSEPGRIFAALQRAEIRKKSGAIDEAEADLRYALENKPDEKIRAEIEQRLQEIEESRNAEAKSRELAALSAPPAWGEVRTQVRAYEEARDKESLKQYLESLKRHNATKFYALLKLAYVRMYSGDLDGAKNELDEASRLSETEKKQIDVEKAWEHLARLHETREKRELAKTTAAAKKGAKVVRRAKPKAWGPRPYVVFKRVSRHLQHKEYDEAERALRSVRIKSLRRNEQGIYTFYRSEIAWYTGKREQAVRGYHKASSLMTSSFWLASAQMRLAQYYASQNDKEKALEFLERAVELSPNEAWRMQQAGRVCLSMQAPDKAAGYFRRSLESDSSPQRALDAYKGLADSYKVLRDMKKYLEQAVRYVTIAHGLSDSLTSSQESTAAYFRAELYRGAGDARQAIAEYQRSAKLTSERFSLADIHHKLAECYAETGELQQAAVHAEKAAELLSDHNWSARRAAGLFKRIGNFESAIAYSKRALELDPEAPASHYQSLALLYLRYGDRESFTEYNKRYIDMLGREVEALGAAAPEELLQRLYNARWLQTGASRTWGFNSYHFGFRNTRQNYYYGMSNELYRNFKLPNGWAGKAYLGLQGTPTSYYDGNYYNQYSGRTGKWQSRKNLGDTLQGIAGLRIKPFFFLPDLGVGVEEIFPLGQHDTKTDFRLRAVFFKSSGKKPRLFGSNWPYYQLYGDVIYSTRYNDFLSYGHARYGRSLTSDLNRNVLVIPYAGFNWSYSGQDASKGKRWGLQGGPGVLFKFWFNEDKYHAPRSSLELGVYYHWGMSHDGRNAVGFNVSLSF